MIVVIAVVAACLFFCSVNAVVLLLLIVILLLLLLLLCCVAPFLLAYCLISLAFAPIVQQKWQAKFVTHTHAHSDTDAYAAHTFACTHGQLLILFRFPFLFFAHTIYCSVSFFLCSFFFLFNCLICPIANLVLLCYVCVSVRE